MTLALWWLLEESHPPEQRRSFAPRRLLAGYLEFARDRPFTPLLIASSVNFAGLFLFIASAPRIIRELLQLSAQGFPWLFMPVVIGLVSGAWLSGRLADRRGVTFAVNLGYALMLLACAMHVAVALWFPSPRLPWSMLPLIVQGVGVQLAFPTLTLLLLDRFPAQRGSASSVQAFFSLMLNATVAGVLSPWLSSSMLALALGASVLSLIGWLAWRWYLGTTQQLVVPRPRDVALQAQIAEPR